MPEPQGSITMPEVVTWELRDKKTGEVRTFQQSELSIESEVRLVQLAGKTIQRLNENGFPWQEVTGIMDEKGDIKWDVATNVLMLAITEVPEFIAESTAIVFGLEPFLENGARNKDYDTDKAFLKRALSFTKWIDLVQTFTKQNDYERLAGPFSLAARRAIEMGMLVQQERQIEYQENLDSYPLSTSLSPEDTETQEE